MDRHAVLVLPRPGRHRRAAARLHAQFRAARGRRQQHGARCNELRLNAGVRRRLQSRPETAPGWRATTSRRMASLGNRLWHSDASFRAVPARYSILSGRIVTTDSAATPSSPTCAPPTTRSMPRTKAEVEDPRLRAFADLLAPAARLLRVPARRACVDAAGAAAPGAHASGDRPQVIVPVGPYRRHRQLAAARGDGLHPRPDRARHAA